MKFRGTGDGAARRGVVQSLTGIRVCVKEKGKPRVSGHLGGTDVNNNQRD